ncbi:MAG TPA: hypothetical protein VF855_00280 [Acidimicrobiales bacterium]
MSTGQADDPSGRGDLEAIWQFAQDTWTAAAAAAEASRALPPMLDGVERTLRRLGPPVAGRSHSDEDLDRLTAAIAGVDTAISALSAEMEAQRWDGIDRAAATARERIARLDELVAVELPVSVGARLQDTDWLIDDVANHRLPRLLRSLVEPADTLCQAAAGALDALAGAATATGAALALEPVGAAGSVGAQPSEPRVAESRQQLAMLTDKLSGIEAIAFDIPEESDDDIRTTGATCLGGVNPWAHLAIQPITTHTPGAGNVW